MNRGDRRRTLLDGAAEGGEGAGEVRVAEAGDRPLLEHLPLQVIAVGAHPQLDDAPVGLVALQVGQQPGGGAQGDGEHPGHGRVQGPPMAHPFEPIGPADARDTAVGAHPCRLVEYEKAADQRWIEASRSQCCHRVAQLMAPNARG